MSKIQISKLVQDEIRVVIPYIEEDGKTEHIVIKNPKGSFKNEVGDAIWKGIEDPTIKKSQAELMGMLFDELTNIELDIDLDSVLDVDLSYELNTAIFYISEILTEITNEALMSANLNMSKILTKDLKDGMIDKTNAIESNKKIKSKKVKQYGI